MIDLNSTHDVTLKSWVDSANEDSTDFPIQNLPLGVFRENEKEQFRCGVGIGNFILDISKAAHIGLLSGVGVEACKSSTLNSFMDLGPVDWSEFRANVSALLKLGGPQEEASSCLVSMQEAEMGLPASIGDFTDFYSSINHATNVGSMFRPDNPLLPNYKYVPIAYHGRTSSIRVSGEQTIRPKGQLKPPDAEVPEFGPCKRLDYETELGIFVGSSTKLGTSIDIEEVENHIFGLCILNDWSARDIQTWEYQPLGPFMAKNFSSIISPWVVTLEALAPFRTKVFERPDGDPMPLPYLNSSSHQDFGGLDINIEVAVSTEKMRASNLDPHVIGSPGFKDMYWTIFQMLTHHTSNGCSVNSGDLYGSGTVSGTTSDTYGSILEACKGGKEKIEFPGGETRTFLEDGDEVIMRAWCAGAGKARIGFGECRSIIMPAS